MSFKSIEKHPYIPDGIYEARWGGSILNILIDDGYESMFTDNIEMDKGIKTPNAKVWVNVYKGDVEVISTTISDLFDEKMSSISL